MKKKFEFRLCPNGLHYLYKDNELYFDKNWDHVVYEMDDDICDLLTQLHDENKQLKSNLNKFKHFIRKNYSMEMVRRILKGDFND